MKLFVAPLQGYTDAPYRHFHTQVYGAVADEVYSPFLRIEKGEPARRTLRDILSPLNDRERFVPQVIFRDADELATLAGVLKGEGFRRIDLNMGCPFPPQVHKVRGAGFVSRQAELAKGAEYMAADTDTAYSVKMRLGVDDPEEWEPLAPVLRDMPLSHLTIHPRTARQQYRGELHLDSFERLAETTGQRIVYNGELHTPADIADVAARWPWLHGVMAGRGLLGRPSLFNEWSEEREWPAEEKMRRLRELHSLLLGHYSGVLCGEAQLLAKMKGFWDYADGISPRGLKGIKKARNMAGYEEVVRGISPL